MEIQRMQLYRRLMLGVVVGWGLSLSGCGGTPAPKAPAKAAAHDHDHDHAHEHKGPHGGKMAVVGEEKYHLEWTHDDDSGKVALYVLDKAGKKEVAIGAEKLTLVTKQGDKEESFDLEAVGRTEDKTPKFEIVNKELLGTIEQLGEKITATVKEIEIEGEKFSNVKLEEHDHHDH
jgi:hypothetical protein